MTQLDIPNSSLNTLSINRRAVPSMCINIGPAFLIFLLILMVSLISVMTLMFSTKEITKGYTLKKLEAEHEQLLRDNEAKNMHVAEVRALASIKSSLKAQTMVIPGKVVYFRGDTAIAKR